MEKERFEYLVSQIFRVALEVHKSIGPGLLESIYEYCSIKELQGRRLPVARQVKVP
jgi:GxxExxY protein